MKGWMKWKVGVRMAEATELMAKTHLLLHDAVADGNHPLLPPPPPPPPLPLLQSWMESSTLLSPLPRLLPSLLVLVLFLLGLPKRFISRVPRKIDGK